MNEKLQDLAWSVLPKEFKEEVKKYYRTLHEQYKDYDGLHFETAKAKVQERIVALQYSFGPHNLTSDAEGEDELLTVPRKDIVELYQEVQKTINQCKSTELATQSIGIRSVIWSFFGSKCLPDEAAKDSQSPAKETASKEPKTAGPKYDLGDKVTLNGHGRFVITSLYLDPYTQEYKYRIGGFKCHFCESDLEPYTEPSNEESAVLRADSVKELRIADEESHLRNLSQEIANCDKQFDTILKDSISKERRLNIAKDFVSVLLGRLNYDPFAAQINCCCSDGEAVNPYINIARIALSAADALITESKKGETI